MREGNLNTRFLLIVSMDNCAFVILVLLNSLVYRYPLDFCGPEVTPLFQTHGDYSGWIRFAQLFNPLSKAKDIVVSYGKSLSMIPRSIVNKEKNNTGETSGFVIVLLVNSTIVTESFSMQSFENCATYVSPSLWLPISYHNVYYEKKCEWDICRRRSVFCAMF